MQISLSLSVLIVFLSRIHTGLQNSECDDGKYTTINDSRRSTANVQSASNNEKKLCDQGIIQDDKWYRFIGEAGGEMPTKAPKRFGCGTTIPIWMNGSHPSVEEGAVNRTACSKAVFHNCLERYNIKVRNCSGFYIYQLKEPHDCYSAYCAGSKKINCTNAPKENYCLKNRPPYITMPRVLYAYEKIEFQFFFNATDPEGYPLVYHFELMNATEDNDTIAITRNGTQMTVTIYETKSRRISLIVKDLADRRVQTTHMIEIVALPCPCQNGGTCNSTVTVSTEVEDLSNYTCSCLKSYTGKTCEVGHFEVETEFIIISGLKWNDDLLKKSSLFYNQTTSEIEAEVRKVYKNTREFRYAEVIEYREDQRGVVVKIETVFKNKISEPLKPWKTHLKSNKGDFGRFKVYLNSSKETGTSDSSEKRSFYGLSKAAFIALMCVVGMVALTGIVLFIICLMKKEISIVILCMSNSRRRIVPINDNNDTSGLQQSKSAHHPMELNSVSVQGTSVER